MPSETHRAKMVRKAKIRSDLYREFNSPVRVHRLLGFPAMINRHTGRPHENKREIARRLGN